jgi:flagellar biosynthesis protein FliQ
MRKYYCVLFAIFIPSVAHAESSQTGISSVATKIQNFSLVFFPILISFFIMGMIVNSKMGIKSRQKRQLILSVFNGVGVVVGAWVAKNQFL